MKPEYSVMQNSAIPHPYKWTIADVWSGKVFISTVNLLCFELWMDQVILFEITRGFAKTNLIKIRPKEFKKFSFSVLNTFFRNYMCFAPYSSMVISLGLSVYSCHTIAMPQSVKIALICNTWPNLQYILSQFLITLALICNSEAAPICNNFCPSL